MKVRLPDLTKMKSFEKNLTTMSVEVHMLLKLHPVGGMFSARVPFCQKFLTSC